MLQIHVDTEGSVIQAGQHADKRQKDSGNQNTKTQEIVQLEPSVLEGWTRENISTLVC